MKLRSVASYGLQIPNLFWISALVNGEDADNFSFFIRNKDEALIGMGDVNGDIVSITGSGSGGGNGLTSKGLRDHLEDEGFVFEHQEIDREKFVNEARRVPWPNKDPLVKDVALDGLTETACFKTIASARGHTVSNFKKLALEDYFDLNNYEGCLKTVEGFCPRCSHILGVFRQSYGVFDRFYQVHPGLEKYFYERNPNCPRYDENSPETCSPKIQEVVDYWNRQRRNYFPNCNLMLDRTSDPWRLAGICSHPDGGSSAVEFEGSPIGDFMYDENDDGHSYQPNSHQYNQYNSYSSSTNIFPTLPPNAIRNLCT
eukprot:CAMPEP_0118634190 /NCGR_PEP_ID=MMETSP0785-20121206/1404_1 /TAXON_ID=91992 /ORGANISM="Bolidomonas pacifica, Strain CCMP 1866" /LENGTH=313 /DNA_ID=CAMNT_0006525127 /DNA_START=179 /DNA_END=1117 /DNA_ORIENTATION=+